MIGSATLGCDPQYDVYVGPACGDTRMIDLYEIAGFEYNRLLDGTSEAELVITADGNQRLCRTLFNRLVEWRQHLIIKRNGLTVWRGPLMATQYTPDEVIITAKDPTVWWSRRFFFREEGDVVSHLTEIDQFEQELFYPMTKTDDCSQAFPPFCFAEVYRRYGGEAVELVIDKKERSMMDAQVKTHADSWLDYTVVGDVLLYGHMEVPIPDEYHQRDLLLTGRDWRVEPEYTRGAGEEYATEVRVIGKDDVETGLSYCNTRYGLHQKLLSSEDTDYRVLQQVARSYLKQFSASTTTVTSSTSSELSADCTWDLPRMIPGQAVTVESSLYGETIREVLRLHEVTVTVVGGNEKVGVNLAPVGDHRVTL